MQFTSVRNISLRIIFCLFFFPTYIILGGVIALALFRTKGPVAYLTLSTKVFKVRWIKSISLKYKWHVVAASFKLSVVIFSLLKLEIRKYNTIKVIEGHKKKSFEQIFCT